MGNRFSFAGLDFIFDRKMKPYFLEANSFPGIGLWYKIYGDVKPIKMLNEYLKKKNCKKLVILTTKNYVSTPSFKSFISSFNKGMKNIDVHICIIKRNKNSIRRNYRKLVDVDGNPVKFDCILRRKPLFKYNPRNVFELNSPEVMRITRNKWLSYLAIRNAFIRSPTSFLVRNMKNVERVLMENRNMFKYGFVLKPAFGEGGKNIYIAENIEQMENIEIKRPYLLQRFIRIKKMEGKWWDLRAFVVGGKYVGSVIRVSDSPVTNISLGGMAKRVPKEIENKIKKRAEKCVRIIENFSEML